MNHFPAPSWAFKIPSWGANVMYGHSMKIASTKGWSCGCGSCLHLLSCNIGWLWIFVFLAWNRTMIETMSAREFITNYCCWSTSLLWTCRRVMDRNQLLMIIITSHITTPHPYSPCCSPGSSKVALVLLSVPPMATDEEEQEAVTLFVRFVRFVLVLIAILYKWRKRSCRLWRW